MSGMCDSVHCPFHTNTHLHRPPWNRYLSVRGVPWASNTSLRGIRESLFLLPSSYSRPTVPPFFVRLLFLRRRLLSIKKYHLLCGTITISKSCRRCQLAATTQIRRCTQPRCPMAKPRHRFTDVASQWSLTSPRRCLALRLVAVVAQSLPSLIQHTLI